MTAVWLRFCLLIQSVVGCQMGWDQESIPKKNILSTFIMSQCITFFLHWKIKNCWLFFSTYIIDFLLFSIEIPNPIPFDIRLLIESTSKTVVKPAFILKNSIYRHFLLSIVVFQTKKWAFRFAQSLPLGKHKRVLRVCQPLCQIVGSCDVLLPYKMVRFS